jgi:CheY-like chemotaxis protein
MHTHPHIILAEDDESVRTVVARLLSLYLPGVTLSAVPDGAAALDIYRHRGADLVLSDCDMPFMDGCTLTAALRAEGASLPIVLMSAGSDCAAQGRAAGATVFVEKRISLRAVVDAVCFFLRQ